MGCSCFNFMARNDRFDLFLPTIKALITSKFEPFWIFRFFVMTYSTYISQRSHESLKLEHGFCYFGCSLLVRNIFRAHTRLLVSKMKSVLIFEFFISIYLTYIYTKFLASVIKKCARGHLEFR